MNVTMTKLQKSQSINNEVKFSELINLASPFVFEVVVVVVVVEAVVVVVAADVAVAVGLAFVAQVYRDLNVKILKMVR